MVMPTPSTTLANRLASKLKPLLKALCVRLGSTRFFKECSAAAQEVALRSEQEPELILPEGSHKTFTHYVKNKNDLVGFVAYSIYKQHKISFLSREFASTGNPASQDKVDAFCSSYGNPEQVNLLRERAEKLIKDLNQVLLDDSIRKVQEDYEVLLVQKLKEGASWPKSIAQSIVGNVMTALFVGAVIFGGSIVAKGFWPTVGDWTGMDIKERAKPPEQSATQPPQPSN